MKYQWLYLFGAVAVTASAAGACASKVGGSGAATTSAAVTSGAGGTSTTTSASGGGTATAGGGTSGAGGMKCTTPGMLHPPKMGETKTIYCPFSGTPNIYCERTKEHCCEPKMGTATCQPTAATCNAGETDWRCQDPSDCATGEVCCSNDGAILQVNPDTNCANFANAMNSTHCAKTCLATEITMCTADGQCGAKKCTPFSKQGAQVGGCK